MGRKKNRRSYKPFNIKSDAWYIPGIGNKFHLSGLVFEGEGQRILLALPQSQNDDTFTEINKPEISEWSEILALSDNPVYRTDGQKPWIRKVERTISGFVQQKIWVRDNCQCIYCGVKMGDALMTVDHFIPLELGGEDNPGNYVTACRRCNKDKDSIAPQDWLIEESYQKIKNYLTQI